MMENKETFKIAFVGGGINSAVGSAHYASINLDKLFDLEAGFFSREYEKNIASSKKYQVQENRVYNNLNSLLEKEKSRLDAIIVLSPTDMHFQHVKEILEFGYPVISEKALTTSVQEAEELKKIVNQKNSFLTVIYNYLGYPMVRELKHIINSGKIGKIQDIQIEMPQDSFARINDDGSSKTPQNWRLQDKNITTVSLDLGVHLHMLIKYLINRKPKSVISSCHNYGNFPDIIDDVSCIIEYDDNVTCNMWYSKIALGNRNGMKVRIYGEKGSAEWIQENPEILYLSDPYGNRWWTDRGNNNVKISNQSRYTRFKAGHPVGFIEAFANYYVDIYDALKTYKTEGKILLNECFGINESLEGLKLFEAIDRSCKTRKWESIDY